MPSQPAPVPQWLVERDDWVYGYSVYHTEYGVLILANMMPPGGEISALAKHFHYEDLPVISFAVPKALGCLGIAFIRSPSVEQDWLADIGEFYGK